MGFHTDLTIESVESVNCNMEGIRQNEYKKGDITVNEIEIESNAAERIGRKCGKYITLSADSIYDFAYNEKQLIELFSENLSKLLNKVESVLVCGIGNRDITPDALGPLAADKIFATRHLSKQLAQSTGLGELTPVSVISPGVLGQTGLEVGETLKGIVEKTKPSAVIVIDALAAIKVSRLCTTIQLSDTGITPGSGVHNARAELSEKTLGLKVISVGVPTVADAEIFIEHQPGEKRGNINHEPMIVTPREIDMIIRHAAIVAAMGINCTLQPHISPDDMALLVG